MDFRVGQLQYAHKPQSVVYKIDYFMLETLLSSFILLNIKVVFCLYLRTKVIKKEINRTFSTEGKHINKFQRGTKTTIFLVSSLAKKTGDSIADANKAYINERSGRDKHSYNIPVIVGRVCNSYTIDINRERNCYSYERFGYLVRNCKNWRIVE